MTLTQSTSILLGDDAYSMDALLAFVSLGKTVVGETAVRAFLSRHALSLAVLDRRLDSWDQVMQEQGLFVKRSVREGRSMMEEALLHIKHDEELEWLLPGLPASHQSLFVPLILVTEWNAQDKVVAKRLYWDQGTLLKQGSQLPSSLNALSVGKEQLVSCFMGLQPDAQPSVSAGVEASVINRRAVSDSVGGLLCGDSEPHVLRPSTRVNAQFVGGKDHICFGKDDQEGIVEDKVGGKRLSKVSQHQSHFSLSHDPTPKLQELHVGKRPGSSIHHAVETSVEQEYRSRHANPNRNQSQLGGTWSSTLDENGKPPVAASKSVAWESSSNGLGTVQNRPSSRVLKAPGGGSTFSFY